MFKRIFIISVALFVIGGCAKKKKPEEAPPEATSQDNSIESKDMTFDAQGSDSGKIEGLYTIHFDFDKSTLTTEGRKLAQKDARWIKSHRDFKVQIEGHCDRHGSIEYNVALGERRAKTVKSYLVSLGVHGKQLSTISYGKERPLDSSETDEADAKNRRANFVVSK